MMSGEEPEKPENPPVLTIEERVKELEDAVKAIVGSYVNHVHAPDGGIAQRGS